jgi:two-component system OmpR family sensor kinase
MGCFAHVPRRSDPGLATVHTGEGAWRVYSLVSGDLQVQVSQPLRVRNQLAARLALRTLLPGLALLPALGLLVWLTVSRGLRPLDRLAQDLGARDSRQLERVPEAGLPNELLPRSGRRQAMHGCAVPEAGLPNELLPLVRALNGLLERLGRALETQRQFVGDAAHELRTPLTAVPRGWQSLRR